MTAAAFADLAAEPRWVIWQNEPRGPGGKLTKIPRDPVNDRNAKADDPGTWGTLAEAVAKAQRVVNGSGGGVGVQLGDLGADTYLVGADLDSCINEGLLADWAATILAAAPTYAEISPSGRGLKIFFYLSADDVRPFLDRLGVEDGWGMRRSMGAGGGDHGPAVEFYAARRFFTVTGDLWPGQPDRIALLGWPALERLAALIPPPRSKAAGNGEATGDDFRSAIAFRNGRELRRAGKSFEEMVEALRQDPETAEWVREKGDAAGRRELKRIWEKAGRGSNSDDAEAARIIPVRAGERHLAADEGIAALDTAAVPFYQRDKSLVRVCEVKARSTSGEVLHVPGIATVTPAILDRALGQFARWGRFDPKTQKMVRTDPPRLVVNQILDMAGSWPFAPLTGVIGCPTLRPDGSLLDAEGYDLATGLVLISAVAMPALSDCPTRNDAEAALGLLDDLLTEFPLVDDAGKSVALSMLMTPVLRGAMGAAPMHLITAPQPGSGKSYLADTASMIATGERAAAVAVAPNPEETEKRLIGSALAGHPIIALDNCRDTLEGDFLCQLTERPLLQLRALGKSDKIRVANTFTTFANGNNINVADDLVRRTISCALDANLENPECRTFHGDPLADVRRARGDYIAAALTIARAFIAAGKPGHLPPLPSYEGWSDVVRAPLVWLGRADPVDTMAAARSADPVRQDRARAFAAWRDNLGIDRAFTVPELIESAQERRSYDGSAARPDILAALLAVAQKHGGSTGQIEPRRLGKWLKKQENTIATGLKMTVDRTDQRRVRYTLQAAAK